MDEPELDAQDRQAVAALSDGRRENWRRALEALVSRGSYSPSKLSKAMGWNSTTSASRALRGLADLGCAEGERERDSDTAPVTYFPTDRGRRILPVVSDETGREIHVVTHDGVPKHAFNSERAAEEATYELRNSLDGAVEWYTVALW